VAYYDHHANIQGLIFGLRVIETTGGPNQYLYVGLCAGAVESLNEMKPTLTSILQLNENTIDFIFKLHLLSAIQHHYGIFPLLPGMSQKPRAKTLHKCFAQNVGQIVYILIYTHHWEPMKSVGSYCS
jgi:hypothetical protein